MSAAQNREDQRKDRMDAPAAYFAGEHQDCDEAWSQVEAAIDARAPEAAERFRAFEAAMRRHFAMEEEVLFPALEDATGMRSGPTVVMRAEHAQMRAVLDQMAYAANLGELADVLDHGDTLLMIIQQHNVKEENILYPMADRALLPRWPELKKKLSRY